jgi:signal transduction histidine kinase/ActR/RegA family two-component response regulator
MAHAGPTRVDDQRTLRFKREVADRFGVLPNFFCSADAAPGLVEELWKFAKSAYLDSPLPSLFKERLFVHLSRFCEIRYCIVRHVGFLIGQGRPAGDPDAKAETIEDVIELLRRPLPEGAELATALDRLDRASLAGRLPEPRTDPEADLFDALTIMFLSPQAAGRARVAVRLAVGDATFEILVAYLAFVRTAHYWTENHPELTFEPDMAAMLRDHGELAGLLLDTSEAELIQGGLRLRETVHQLRRAEGALQERESRHAFLLRLSDDLRLLVDPVAIQGETSRLLGERLLTDRVHYAAIDEAQDHILIQQGFARDGASNWTGRYSLSHFNWVGPALRAGGAVVVADIANSPWMPEADRPAVAAIDVGAFVAAPLIRAGRLVAALCVSDVSPRAWTPEEVELIKETAERTWEAVERARAEEQLREAAVRKDEFLAMLAHELRNPLAPILFSIEIMRRANPIDALDQERPDRNPRVDIALDVLQRQVGQMVRLVDDLLDAGRIGSGKIELRREQVELASVVHHVVDAVRPLTERRSQDLTVALPATPVYVSADPTRLAQIMGNLLNNASKFSERGGRIWLTVERSAEPRLDDGEAAPGVVIRVRDHGSGIPADRLEQIFDMFTQIDLTLERTVSGLGIGLTLAKTLTEMHGGTVEATSPGIGHGSEFIVWLPIVIDAALPAPPPPTIEASVRPLRILVVDDNRDSADMLASLLTFNGHMTHIESDGLAAVEAVRKLDPDVVVLDIGLPVLNGYDAARRIRKEHGGSGRPFLIALTGWGQDEDRLRSMEAGFDAHLVKPVEDRALRKLLSNVSADR